MSTMDEPTTRPQPGAGPSVDAANLRELRRTLAEQMAGLQWDLGGLAYEMAIRDHFRIDTLVRVAARLQEVDAELGAVERLLALEENGAAGTCPVCGALHSRGALFCEQCGTRLMDVAEPPDLRAARAARGEAPPPAPPSDDDEPRTVRRAGPPPPPPGAPLPRASAPPPPPPPPR